MNLPKWKEDPNAPGYIEFENGSKITFSRKSGIREIRGFNFYEASLMPDGTIELGGYIPANNPNRPIIDHYVSEETLSSFKKLWRELPPAREWNQAKLYVTQEFKDKWDKAMIPKPSKLGLLFCKWGWHRCRKPLKYNKPLKAGEIPAGLNEICDRCRKEFEYWTDNPFVIH